MDKNSPDALSDGSVLMALKVKLVKEATEEALIALLSCLKDSKVLVPFNVILSPRDQERYRQCKYGDTFKNQDSVRMEPDLLRHPDGSLYFPIFSRQDQVPMDYASRFSIVPISTMQCLQAAHDSSGVKGLVLDAFTESFSLPFELADIMKELP